LVPRGRASGKLGFDGIARSAHRRSRSRSRKSLLAILAGVILVMPIITSTTIAKKQGFARRRKWSSLRGTKYG
jgi:hypothetical protein